MAIVSIDGRVFDTAKAKLNISIAWHDGSNMVYGEIFQSYSGTWYVYTPSQWSNRHNWEIMSPAEILGKYGHMLSEVERERIVQAAGIETE